MTDPQKFDPNRSVDPNVDRDFDIDYASAADDNDLTARPEETPVVREETTTVRRETPVVHETPVARERVTSTRPASGATEVEVNERSGLPGWLKLLGGLATIISMFLPWITKQVDDTFRDRGTGHEDDVDRISQNLNGMDTDYGKIVLALGILLAILGLMWALGAAGRAKWIPALGALTSLGILGITLYQWTRIGSWVTDNWPDSWSKAGNDIQNLVTSSVGTGVWIALLGGLLGLVGSLLAMATRHEVDTVNTVDDRDRLR